MLRMSASVPLLLVLLAPVAADEAKPDEKKLLGEYANAEVVFVATLEKVIEGPTALSAPPIYSHTLNFAKFDMLRGKTLKDGTGFRHSFRGEKPPEFPVFTRLLVGAKKQGDGWLVTAWSPANDKLVQATRQVLLLPVGWKLVDGKPLSPWADVKAQPWYREVDTSKVSVCAKSGRPALLVGEAVELVVEQVPPENLKEFQNPFGDGKFKVIVRNPGKEAVDVPALLTDGREIFWRDSLVVMNQGKAQLLPGAGRATAGKAVRLKPGESVSTVVDVLPLKGIDWPRGGSRVAFQFCLGDKTVEQFFYYYSALHDKMRDEAIRQLKDSQKP